MIRDDNESLEMLMEEISHRLSEVDESTRSGIINNLRILRNYLEAQSRQNSRKLA